VKAVGAAFPVGRARKTIDSKGRIQLPAHQGFALGDTVHVCPGVGPFLEIHGAQSWEEYRERLMRSAQCGPRRFRALLRRVLGNATEAKIDPQFRLVLPRDALELAHLSLSPDAESREVVVVGVGECVEVWAPDELDSQSADEAPLLGDVWDEMRQQSATASSGPSSEGRAAHSGDEPQ